MKRQMIVARKVAESLKDSDKISMLLLGGSIALGYGGDNSDIDLYAFYKDGIPSEEELKSVLKYEFDPVTLKCCKRIDFILDNIPVSISLENINTLNYLVSIYPHINLGPYITLQTHMNSILLFDKTNKFDCWKKSVSEFPEDLKKNVIANKKDQLKFYLTYDRIMEKFRKNDIICVQAMIYEVVYDLLTILFALNNKVIYYDYPVWCFRQIEDLEIKPKDFLIILNKAISLANTEEELNKKVLLFKELLSSIDLLIDKHIID